MINIIKKTTDLAKLICDCYVDNNSIVIDATCGNGNDTLYYAQKCKFIYGFDIQKQAIDNTDNLLKENNLSNYQLFLQSHANMKNYIEEKAQLVLFNLGYLPNADKEITTNSYSTLQAINAALDLLEVNGLICVVMYYGHIQGKQERSDLLDFCQNLDGKNYHVGYFSSPNQKKDPPEIICITRKK